MGDAPGAEADFTHAIKLDPKFGDAFFNRGKVRNEMTDFDGAIEDYDKAVELNPRDPSAYYNRGLIKEGRRALEEALADFSRVITLDPKQSDAYFQRAIVNRAKGNNAEAIDDLTKAIKLNPQMAEAYSDRGGLLEENRDTQAALADLNQAIELNPSLPNAYLNRGIVEFRDGSLEKALIDFEKLIDLKPDLPEAYQNRSVVREALGDKEGALNDSMKAAQLRAIKSKSPFGSPTPDLAASSALTKFPSPIEMPAILKPLTPAERKVREKLKQFMRERTFDYNDREVTFYENRLFELAGKVAKARKTSTNGERVITVSLTEEGATQMAEFSTRNKDAEVGMLLNGELISVATLRDSLSHEFNISGRQTEEEADEIVSKLKKAIKNQPILGINFPLHVSVSDLVIWVSPVVFLSLAFAFIARRRRFKVISRGRIAGDSETSRK